MKKVRSILVLLTVCMTAAFLSSGCGDEVYEGKKNKDKEKIEEEKKSDSEDMEEDAGASDENENKLEDDAAIDDENQDSNEGADSNQEEDNEDNDESENDNESENHEAIEALAEEKKHLLYSENVVDKTINIYDINKQIAELNTYDFSDTKITFIGDSLTYGQGGDYNEYGNHISYVDYVRDILGCQTNNMAVAGSTIGSYNGYDGMVYKADLIPEDTDIIVIFGGVNDYFFGKDCFGDDSYTEGTFTGDTKKMFSTVRSRFPDKPVYVILVYNGRYEVNDNITNVLPIDEYMKVERELASQAAFNVIDLNIFGLLNNNEFDLFAKYYSDEVHLNNDGYMWLGRYVAAEIVQDFN